MTISPIITFINDEVSDSLDTVINFAKDNQLNCLEIRSVGGTNLMNLSLSEIKDIANKIHENGIKIICFASPLLKWLPRGKISSECEVNWHGYKPAINQIEEVFEKAFIIADILQTQYIRVFSYLKYEDFDKKDLEKDFSKLLNLAEKYDKIILLENEPVCNILTLEQQLEFISHWDHPRLKALLDIGNLYQANIFVDDREIEKLLPYIFHVHIKDFSISESCYVTVGQGSVSYEQHLKNFKNNIKQKNIYFSLETHVDFDKLETTKSSMLYLHQILEKLKH